MQRRYQNKSICLCIQQFQAVSRTSSSSSSFFSLLFARLSDVITDTEHTRETGKKGKPMWKQDTVKYMESHYEALMGKLTSFDIIYLLWWRLLDANWKFAEADGSWFKTHFMKKTQRWSSNKEWASVRFTNIACFFFHSHFLIKSCYFNRKIYSSHKVDDEEERKNVNV